MTDRTEAEHVAREVLVRMLDEAEAEDRAVSTDPMSVAACAIMAERQFKAEIAVEIYRALERLTARSDLLGIIGSYGNTQRDGWVLEQLLRYNEQNRI